MEPNLTPSDEPAEQLPPARTAPLESPPARPPAGHQHRGARGARDSFRRRALLGAAGLAGVAALRRLAHAGDLSPPPGPISPTGTSLGALSTSLQSQLQQQSITLGSLSSKIASTAQGIAEPRIPVTSLPSSGDAQFVITAPGAYCLTGNLAQVPGMVCIDIQADHVDIDGQGFVFLGGGGGGGGGGFSSCVRSSGHQAIELYDCAFSGWQGACCDLTDCDDVHLSDILFHACVSPPDGAVGQAGAVVRCGDRCVIEDCVSSSCTGVAYELRAHGTFSDGCVLDATGNALRCGAECCVEASSFLRVSGSVLVVGGSCTVSDCTISHCGDRAIDTGPGCVVECCEVSFASSGGVRCADGSCVADCSFVRVTGDVVVVGSSSCVSSCECRLCDGQAVTTGSSCSVEDCDVTGGTGGGIRCADGCCVEDCSVVDRDAVAIDCGSRCSISSNHVVRCWNLQCLAECSVCDNDLSSCTGGPDSTGGLGGAITIIGPFCTCEENWVSSSRVGISLHATASSSLVHSNHVTGAGTGVDPTTGPGAGLVVHDAASGVTCTCNHLLALPGSPPFLPGTSSFGPLAVLSSGDLSSVTASSHPLANTVGSS